MSQVKVISQQPPGGRCTLYASYAEAIAGALGWNCLVVSSECRDAHGAGFPSLWIGHDAVQPGDGVIIAPEDICTGLAGLGVDAVLVATLHIHLTGVLDDFLENEST